MSSYTYCNSAMWSSCRRFYCRQDRYSYYVCHKGLTGGHDSPSSRFRPYSRCSHSRTTFLYLYYASAVSNVTDMNTVASVAIKTILTAIEFLIAVTILPNNWNIFSRTTAIIMNTVMNKTTRTNVGIKCNMKAVANSTTIVFVRSVTKKYRIYGNNNKYRSYGNCGRNRGYQICSK